MSKALNYLTPKYLRKQLLSYKLVHILRSADEVVLLVPGLNEGLGVRLHGRASLAGC